MGAVATIIIATALAIAIEHVGRCRLQAAIIIATALAIAIEMLFSGSTTSGAPQSNCTSMHSSLQHHDGIFVGDLHGDWDHARALQHALCSKDGASVKTLYIEMVPATLSAVTVDFLRDADDPARADLVNQIWDKWRYGYPPRASNSDAPVSASLDHPYLQLIQSAALCGVEVVGIDVDRSDQPSSGLAYMLGRTKAVNKAWASTIEQHQQQSPVAQKFVVFGGRLHCFGIAASARTGLVHLLPNIRCVEWSSAEACFTPLLGRS